VAWWPWGKEARDRKEAVMLEVAKANRDQFIIDAAQKKQQAIAAEAAQKLLALATDFTKRKKDVRKLKEATDQQKEMRKLYESVSVSAPTAGLSSIAWHQTAMTPTPNAMAHIKVLRDEFEHHRQMWNMNEEAYNNRLAEMDELLAEQRALISDMQDEIDALKAGVVLD
jgi:hypothetical protein